MTCVHPIIAKCFSCDSFRLSDFILMMRENEITPTHMNIYLFTMTPHITSTTLDMPPWSSFEDYSIRSTPLVRYDVLPPLSGGHLKCCFPEILSISWIIAFPESKITHIFFFILIRFGSFSGTCFHTFHIQMCQISIVFG